MTRDEDEESDDDIEDDVFRFFEFLLLASGDEDQPSCIDDEEDAENGEECIEVVDEVPDDTDPFLEILVFDRTATRPEEVIFLTVGTPVDRWDKCSRQTNEKESDKCIDHDIFPFLQFLIISSTRHDDEKCIHHHTEECDSCEELEESDDRGEYIDPELPSRHSSDDSTRIPQKERIPYGKCDLHDKYPDRDPDDIIPPSLHFLFICSRKEELDHSDNEKYSSNPDEEILDREGDIDKGIRNTSPSWFSCPEEEFLNRWYKVLEDWARIPSRTDIGIADIEFLVSECPEWDWVEEDEKREKDEGEEFHMRRFRCPLLYRFSREMQSHAECTIDKVYIEWGNIWQNGERE